MTLALYGKSKRRQGGLMLAALMAILFATLGGVATLRGAGAASVTPVALPNATATDTSPTCGTQGQTPGLDSIYGGGQTWSEFKIEPPANGTVTQGSRTVTITNYVPSASGTPGSFNWTSNFGVDSVLVKAGSTKHNLYVYAGNAAATESTGDTNLGPQSGDGNGISHISFCYDVDPTPPPKLTVTKVVVNTGGGTKVVADFPLQVDTVTVTSGLQITVTAGSHTVSELGDANYIAVITGHCNSSGVVVLAAGDVKACTITNTYMAPPPATRQITVTKVRLGNGPATETFGGSISGAGAIDTSWSIATAAGNNHTSQNRTVANNLAATILETLTGAQTAAGWQLTAYVQVSGLNATCPSSPANLIFDNSVPADTASYTYCVYNTYTAPFGTVVVKKIVSGSGALQTDAFGGSVTGPTAQTFIDLRGNNTKVYTGQTAGSYTVQETNTNGYTLLGYDAGVNTNGVYTCPPVAPPTGGNTGPSASQTLAANGTIVFCIYNQKHAFVVDPSVSKTKHTDGVSGGSAYWNVNVNNTANLVSPYDVTIIDAGASFVSVSGGTCTGVVAGASLNNPGIACMVNANSILVVKVSKPFGPGAACLAQTINNTATVYAIGNVLIATVGGTAATEYTIAADTSKCGQPGITKKSVTGGTEAFSVTDPANVQWTVTVVNPVTLPGTNQTVHIKDQNVVVTADPTLTGGATCPVGGANNTNPNFQTALNTATGVECLMPAGSQTSSSITFTVKPATPPVRTCADQTFNNTAYLQVGTGSFVAANGPPITLTGDQTLCAQNVTFIKYICPTASAIPANPAFGVAVTDAAGGCTRATAGWTFTLGTTTAASDLGTVITDSTGSKTIALSVAQLTRALIPYPNGIRVSEVVQAGYTLGSLRCYKDHFPPATDNDDVLSVEAAGTPGVLCIAYNVTSPGTVIVKKVKDPTTNQPVDGSQFSGNIDGTILWGPIGFGGTTGAISVPAGASHSFAETGTQNAWTPVGFAVTTNASVETACSSNKADYAATVVPVVSNQTTLVCVMNTKASLVALPTIKKVNVDATHYTITVTNAGGIDATNISLNDTFNQGGTTQIISNLSVTPSAPGSCTIFGSFLGFSCSGLTAPANGSLVISVIMSAYTNTAVCSDQIVTNTVTATFDTQGPITITPGFSNVATHTFATTKTDCTNGTIAVKKVRDPGAAFAADGTPFGGTIDGTSWSGFITFGGVTTPKSVNAGSHSVVENTPGNGWLLVGYQVFTNSSTTAACSTNPANYSKSAGNAITAAVSTGQLTLVCVMNTKASTPTVTPDCTNCTPLIVSTPTPTPTSTPVRPTNTPVAPTATPTTPIEVVAGEKTPGPGAVSTPIAPRTGTANSGAASSFNGLLALIGIVILGSGMALMAAGRRRTRN